MCAPAAWGLGADQGHRKRATSSTVLGVTRGALQSARVNAPIGLDDPMIRRLGAGVESMSDDSSFDVIVIGGGVGGAAAALRAAQYSLRVAWIRGDRETARRSRGRWVADVDNMIGLHDGIVRGSILRQLRKPQFAEARAVIESKRTPISVKAITDNTLQRIRADFPAQVAVIDLRADRAERRDDGSFAVTAGERTVRGAAVVLSTGVMDRQPHILKAGKEGVEDDIKWVYPWANREQLLYCIRCEGHLAREQAVAVIGHSDAAASVAAMMFERYRVPLRMVTNGEAPAWGEQRDRLLNAYGAEVHTARIVDVEGDKAGMRAIVLEDGARIEVVYALVSLGIHVVYNDLAIQLGASLEGGEVPASEQHVIIDRRAETDVRGLFVVGDMARRRDEPVMKQIYTAQEYAVRAVDAIDARRRAAFRAAFLRGEPVE
jgi:thioredoxin reductase (NADPH)